MASWPGDRLQGGLSWWRGRERRRPLNSGAACVGCLCHRPALRPSRPVCRASPQRARGSLRFCKRGFPEDGKGAEPGEREKERLFQQVLRWLCWQVF